MLYSNQIPIFTDEMLNRIKELKEQFESAVIGSDDRVNLLKKLNTLILESTGISITLSQIQKVYELTPPQINTYVLNAVVGKINFLKKTTSHPPL
ncbi:MAG: hypothetical protein PHP97_02860 [Candidatus Shapirobacteria bacterium]|nr:hypothetical protein [Candidatus Shapirobacteria bacterium]MDD3002992.1 hypothetical protein [Candidatus Shapirobacteria bacterium]MDD4383140.1 hypothetical protein [Candidatus Shapirobacteria bacterium]